ncbi:MAG: hypothetical protein M9913_00085 [Bryobacteraceae bacterium]|nr:hypothetical protein [Solibacteraceae bacterium]MCL4842553.1 hypothetical protein [Bryobacteraceae bacterium]MCO5349305.1 hypothetical protein [Bryobacteraceae bacterium]
MKTISRPRLAWLAGAFLVAGVLAGWWWLGRAPSANQMLAWLPEGDGPTVYVDFALLRRTGLLDRLAGDAAMAEEDYRAFIGATGFDFRKDLDAALVRWREDATLLVLAGRFDQKRLEQYAQTQGGRCVNGLCSLEAATPGRRISFVRLGRGVLALATAGDAMAAGMISKDNRTPAPDAPLSSAWLMLPKASLRSTAGLPAGLSAFLEALGGAERAVLLPRPTQAGVDLVLEAPCTSPAVAGRVADRLTKATSLLKSLLSREGKEPARDDLSGVLTAGTFRGDGAVVRGFWPLPKEFLDKLSVEAAQPD